MPLPKDYSIGIVQRWATEAVKRANTFFSVPEGHTVKYYQALLKRKDIYIYKAKIKLQKRIIQKYIFLLKQN